MSVRLQSLVRSLRGTRGVGSDRPEPGSTETHVSAAVDWLCRSQDVTGNDGSAACYNLILGWGDAFPETTGYVVPTFYDVAARFDRPALIDRAERMGGWLLDVQFENGAFPAGTYDGSAREPSVFNTGQILRGLLRCYEETGDVTYRRRIVSAVEWLASVQNDDGSWSANDYNGVRHAYSSRVSWPVLAAADAFDLDVGRELAAANLRWVLTQQRADGWFENCGFERDSDPYLHTIAYAVRGLLESARYLDGELASRCRSAGRKTARRLLERQRRHGILEGAFGPGFEPVGDYHCLTGNAQMAVIWSQLAERDDEMEYRSEVSRTVRFLKRTQTMHGPDTIRGGLRGSEPVWGAYMYFRYPNWACKFLVDALLNERRLRNTDDDRDTLRP